jgi:hypothetical protein
MSVPAQPALVAAAQQTTPEPMVSPPARNGEPRGASSNAPVATRADEELLGGPDPASDNGLRTRIGP